MSKKKQNSKVINNIENLNLEIDYDKLAEAIVKAETKQQEIFSPSREWMKYILSFVYWSIAITAGILAIIMIIYILQNGPDISVDTSISKVLTSFFQSLVAFVIAIYCGGFCIVSVFMAKEINGENDRNYVSAMFSNVVAIAALIIALVSLLKGVG